MFQHTWLKFTLAFGASVGACITAIMVSQIIAPPDQVISQASLLSFVIGAPTTLAIAYVTLVLSQRVAVSTSLQEQWNKLTFLRDTAKEMRTPFNDLGHAITRSLEAINAVNRIAESHIANGNWDPSLLTATALAHTISTRFKDLRLRLEEVVDALRAIQCNEFARDLWEKGSTAYAIKAAVDKWEWVASHPSTEGQEGVLRSLEEAAWEEEEAREMWRKAAAPSAIDALLERLDDLTSTMSAASYAEQFERLGFLSSRYSCGVAEHGERFPVDIKASFKWLGIALHPSRPSGYVGAEGRTKNPYDLYTFNIGAALLLDIVHALPSGSAQRQGLQNRIADILHIKPESKECEELGRALSLAIPMGRKPVPQAVADYVEKLEASLDCIITVTEDDPYAYIHLTYDDE